MDRLGFFILSRHILPILGENVPTRGFSLSAGTFCPFGRRMYRLGPFHSQLVHFGHFWPKCTHRGFSFSAGTFWSFWAKMYKLAVLHSQLVHLGHLWRKCIGPRFFILNLLHFSHFGRKCTAWGFFILNRYIWAILGENVPPGGFLFSVGTFWPFWAKMYRLGVFYSPVVHFGHFGRKCIDWGLFILSGYMLAILGGNIPAGGFSFSAGTFWPFWPKMYQFGVLYSQPVHLGQFG